MCIRDSFVFFDDFSTDTSGSYHNLSGDSATISWDNEGYLLVNNTGGSGTAIPDSPDNVVMENFAVEARMMSPAEGDDASRCVGVVARLHETGSNDYTLYQGELSRGHNELRVVRRDSDLSWNTLASASMTFEMNRWYRVSFRLFGENLKVVADGVTVSVADNTYADGTYGMRVWEMDSTWDFFAVRRYVSPEPTASVGDEETLSVLHVETASPDNLRLDRDSDWYSGVVHGTRITVDVNNRTSGENADNIADNARLTIYDAQDGEVVVLTTADISIIDENTKRFVFTFDSFDNTFSDSQLGGFDLLAEAWTESGGYDNLENLSAFEVLDLTGTTNQENSPATTTASTDLRALLEGELQPLPRRTSWTTSSGRWARA